jgi:hypothetical protein
MKDKRSTASLAPESAGIHRRGRRRGLWLRVATILMVIVFLASECVTLIPEW